MVRTEFDRDFVRSRLVAKRDAFAILSIFALLSLLSAGCAPAISKAVRAQVDRNLPVGEAMRDPEAHQGKTILWGGEILSIVNRKDGTLLEVLQKPLDFENRPKEVDSSGGRFMAFIDRYLDPAVYAEGRQVSVAGPIQGKEQRAIGEIQYVYPVVRVVEIHLWPKRVHEPMYYYPDPFWYDRWWWRYPYPYRYPYRWH